MDRVVVSELAPNRKKRRFFKVMQEAFAITGSFSTAKAAPKRLAGCGNQSVVTQKAAVRVSAVVRQLSKVARPVLRTVAETIVDGISMGGR